ncbi:MAG: hypothetical protein ACK4IW_03025 [Brevundimonas aurantiaca]
MRQAWVFPSSPRAVAALFVAAALTAAGAGLWMMTHRSRIAPPETPSHRVVRQIGEQLGPGAELRYAEAGEKRAVCGYVGRSRGGAAVGFISVPNRILFSDDPLPTEFREMRERYCPGFLTPPPSVRLGT